METFLQESGGLRRAAPVQSPVPVTGRLSVLQRAVLAASLITLALAYLAQLLPLRHAAAGDPRAAATGSP